MFVPNKLITINQNLDKISTLPKNTDKRFNFITKVTNPRTDVVGAAKRGVDLTRAIAYQYRICVFILNIGVVAYSI